MSDLLSPLSVNRILQRMDKLPKANKSTHRMRKVEGIRDLNIFLDYPRWNAWFCDVDDDVIVNGLLDAEKEIGKNYLYKDW